MKFEDVEYKVRSSQAASINPVRVVVSKFASQLNLEQDKYKEILKGVTGSTGPGEILALMGPSYNPALKRRLAHFYRSFSFFCHSVDFECFIFLKDWICDTR